MVILAVIVLAFVVLLTPIDKLYEPFVASAPIDPKNTANLDNALCRMVVAAFLAEAKKLPVKNAPAAKCDVISKAARAAVSAQLSKAVKLSVATRTQMQASATLVANTLEAHLLDKQCGKDTKAVKNVTDLQNFLTRLIAFFQPLE